MGGGTEEEVMSTVYRGDPWLRGKGPFTSVWGVRQRISVLTAPRAVVQYCRQRRGELV